MTQAPPLPSELPPEHHVSLRGLVRLRWGVMACQLLVACLQGSTGATAPGWLFLPPLLLGISTLWLQSLLRGPATPGVHVMGAVLVLDTVLWTAFFALGGGASNPFTVLYLVHVTLAAAVLSPAWTWAVVALSVAGYSGLFLWPAEEASPMPGHHHGGSAFDAHLQGMWLGFALAAVLIAAFVSRVSSSLRQWQLQVVQLRERNARNERLASLSTLAAGAAHQLATPLGTIAVAARELEHSLAGHASVEDARLIGAQVGRCRAILDRLNRDAGGTPGEAPSRVPVSQLLEEATLELGSPQRQRLDLGTAPPDATLHVPRHAVVQALCILLSNAFDATEPPGRVALTAAVEDELTVLTVADQGSGMAPDTLAHAGVPFFTTKPPSQGMGLGLFVVRRLVEELGGTFHLDSTEGRGTRAVVSLPRREAA